MNSERPKGLPAAIHRYGSLRSFMLRTLYSWFTLTILYTFTWPLLVVYANAPAVAPEDTPGSWFLVRLALALVACVAVLWLWWVSPAPVDAGRPAAASALLRRGRIWPQVVVFLAGLALLLVSLLTISDPQTGLKAALLGLVEALTVQALLAGYLHSTFQMVLADGRAYLATLGLFALTFAIRGALASATQESAGQELLIVAALAGAVVGSIAGGISLFLRARAGSLLPGVLAFWLLFYILPVYLEG